jgi:hypothetical protein
MEVSSHFHAPISERNWLKCGTGCGRGGGYARSNRIQILRDIKIELEKFSQKMARRTKRNT